MTKQCLHVSSDVRVWRIFHRQVGKVAQQQARRHVSSPIYQIVLQCRRAILAGSQQGDAE